MLIKWKIKGELAKQIQTGFKFTGTNARKDNRRTNTQSYPDKTSYNNNTLQTFKIQQPIRDGEPWLPIHYMYRKEVTLLSLRKQQLQPTPKHEDSSRPLPT